MGPLFSFLVGVVPVPADVALGLFILARKFPDEVVSAGAGMLVCMFVSLGELSLELRLGIEIGDS